MKLVKHPAAVSREKAAAEERLETLRKNVKPGRIPGNRASIAPIIFEHFKLLDESMSVEGKPDLAQYIQAGGFIMHAERGSPFWLADWLLYGDSREDWAKKLEQAQELGGYKSETIEQYKRVARKVPPKRRRRELTYAHHKVIESCAPNEQEELLDKAVTEGWSSAELRREMHATQKRGILRVQAPLEGKFRIIYADPPWIYGDRRAITDSGAYGGADKHYPGMTIEQLCKMAVKPHTTRDAVLFLWVTSPMLAECWPVIEAWGFEYKTSIVWDKVLGVFGHYVRVHHELLLIATRGSCLPDRPTPMPDSVQTIRRSDVHSEKPEEFAKLIEKLYDGPYLELFARKERDGWTTWGNQILTEVATA